MNLKTLTAAYAMLKEQERKQKDYDRLVGRELSYTIIKDLVNSAAFGVVINVTLRDGTKLEIKREDEFDALKKSRASGEYF